VVQPNQPVAAASGVTPASATSGPPGLQPTAASKTIISGEEFNARPASRVGELLEAVPGLVVTQHSGEGKANQYFLRGFNLDHGTDLAIKVDGMPVNMPTHGHGQGYADINFLIPEVVQSVNVRKGPYFADLGDFASAGAIGIDYEKHRGTDGRQLRLSARARRRLDCGRRRHAARGRRSR
jgi:outer membrane cobalamin receptor